jgi:hypothetical protein
MLSEAQPRGGKLKGGVDYPNRSAEPPGGPRAGGNWPGGEAAPSTWDSIFRTVTLSSMHAMIFTAPPQCSHTVTSIKKTRFNRCAHVSVILRAINVANKYGLTQVITGTAFNSPVQGTVIQPRTVELTLKARF